MSTIDTGYLATIAGRGGSSSSPSFVNLIEKQTLFFSAAATTNATVLKASPGRLFGADLWNLSGANAFLKFYDKASLPTVGTDRPVLLLSVPTASRLGWNTFLTHGLKFSTGISFALTGAVTISDTTATAADAAVGAFVFE